MLNNNFHEINVDIINQIEKNFAMPLFIIDKRALIDRYEQFYKISKKNYQNSVIAISYKTNPLPGVLKLLHQGHAYAEVVSGNEYLLACKLDVNKQEIIFNGPMKTDEEIILAISNRSFINCDHFEEVLRIEEIARQLHMSVKIGLRLYLKNIGKAWSRFGFEVTDSEQCEAFQAAQYIHNSDYLSLAGIHTQIGTDIRDLTQFNLMAKLLITFCWRLNASFDNTLEWIDVGGGLSGISPKVHEKEVSEHQLISVQDYMNAVIPPLKEYLDYSHAKLIFEPGRTIFEPFGGLLLKVVGVRGKDEHGISGLVLNAGHNIVPSARYYNHPVYHFNSNTEQKTYNLYGPSCDQEDIIHQPLQLPKMKRNDYLLFHGVGAYCMSFGFSFIRYRPGVVLWNGSDEIELIRTPESLEHILQLDKF